MTPEELQAALDVINRRGWKNKDIARMLAISETRAKNTLYGWRKGHVRPNPQIALMLKGYAYHGWSPYWILEESK